MNVTKVLAKCHAFLSYQYHREFCQQFIGFHDPFLQSCVINPELKGLPIQINFLKCSVELGKKRFYTDKVVTLDLRLIMKANLRVVMSNFIFGERFTVHL